MTHLKLFKSVDQAAFVNVREANDADGGAQRHARFVRLAEVEIFWGRARCQVRMLM